MKTRSRLGKQGFGAFFGLFFDAGPVFSEPALDLPFVALDGPARWFLVTPPQGFQKLADVVEVIRDAKLLFANFGNSFLRPQIARIPVRLGTFEQFFQKLSLLLYGQSGLGTALAFGFQRFLSSLVVRFHPTVNGLNRYPIFLSHFGNSFALPNKPDSSNPPLFQHARIGNGFHT